MSIKHSSVAVGTVATALTLDVADHSGNGYEVARSVLLTNTGAESVLIGGSNVATGDYGYELAAGASVALDLTASDVPYGIAAVGPVTVLVLHTGV